MNLTRHIATYNSEKYVNFIVNSINRAKTVFIQVVSSQKNFFSSTEFINRRNWKLFGFILYYSIVSKIEKKKIEEKIYFKIELNFS